jgi:demethylmenaquinone methyltransferase/2-methoxy-6-polyprenyl-1,4-benzoquinol methylase
VLPRIGRRLSDSASAYDYLPDSVPAFPQRDAFLDRLRDSGFVDGAFEDLSGGIVCLYTARRA